jgi:hypothetical protein
MDLDDEQRRQKLIAEQVCLFVTKKRILFEIFLFRLKEIKKEEFNNLNQYLQNLFEKMKKKKVFYSFLFKYFYIHYFLF